MDIYLLDKSRRREHIIDRFTSFIWTERFYEMGDCEVVLPATQFNRDIFVEDTWMVQNASYRAMIIDTVNDEEDEEGRVVLNVTGRSSESVLVDRLATYGGDQFSTNKKWIIDGTPGDILRFMFQKICIEGWADARDIIPNATMDPFPYYPDGTITEPQVTIHLELELKSMYDAYVDICKTYGLGFALLLHPKTQALHFRVLSGTNRTSAQSDVPALVFSSELDNLRKTRELRSTAKYKNVAVVVSEHGSVEVYDTGTSRTAAGFERRVLLVNASIKEDDADKEGLMRQLGLEELAKNRKVLAFDGEINEYGHRYGEAYFLGDIVEMRKANGPINFMRVTEQIFVDDSGEGERAYPTLTLDSYIAPDAWFSLPPKKTWAQIPRGLTWDNFTSRGV